MLVTTPMLKERLHDYKDPLNKISRMERKGEIIKLVRGLYETDPNIGGEFVANALYSPSYLSFDFALSYYDLIPETVYTYTNATYGKNKTKIYHNKLGTFTYQDVPKKVYPYGIKIIEENKRYFAIACKEKAILDKLYSLRPVKSKSGMRELLFEDLRIDPYELSKLNLKDIQYLGPKYHSTNIDLFIKELKSYE